MVQYVSRQDIRTVIRKLGMITLL